MPSASKLCSATNSCWTQVCPHTFSKAGGVRARSWSDGWQAYLNRYRWTGKIDQSSRGTVAHRRRTTAREAHKQGIRSRFDGVLASCSTAPSRPPREADVCRTPRRSGLSLASARGTERCSLAAWLRYQERKWSQHPTRQASQRPLDSARALEQLALGLGRRLTEPYRHPRRARACRPVSA